MFEDAMEDYFNYSKLTNTIMLEIKPTVSTPAITLNESEGLLEFKGRSSPDNSVEFYSKILMALENYFKTTESGLTTNFNLEYFNTSSLKCIFQIFEKIAENVGDKNKEDVVVNWYYEEEDFDMLETGEDISSMIDFDFNFIKYSY